MKMNSEYDTRYASGRLSTKKSFHLYTDCTRLGSGTIKEVSERDANFHDLSVCEKCKERYEAKILPERTEGERFKTSVYVPVETKELISTLVAQNIFRKEQDVVVLSMTEFNRQLGEPGQSLPTPKPEQEIETEPINARIPAEDRRMISYLVESEWFDSVGAVYRTAVKCYFETLKQEDTIDLSNIDVRSPSV